MSTLLTEFLQLSRTRGRLKQKLSLVAYGQVEEEQKVSSSLSLMLLFTVRDSVSLVSRPSRRNVQTEI